MERRLLAVSILAVIALGVLAAFFLLRDGSDEDGALATMSAQERPVEMVVSERIGHPNSPLLTGKAFLIGERGGLRFLRLPRDDGSSCWANGGLRSGEWQLIGYRCETGFQRFPDREQPVMIVAGFQMIPGTQFLVYDSIAGFAADGVKRIAVIDPRDRLVPMAEVLGNVFYSDGPADRVKGVAALDEGGKVIWRSAEVQLPDE